MSFNEKQTAFLRAAAEDITGTVLPFGVRTEEGAGLTVEWQGGEALIRAENANALCRGFFLLSRAVTEGKEKLQLHQERSFRDCGAMLDMSRNGVMKVDAVKQWLRMEACLGMSFVMLLIMFHRQRQRFLRAAERLPSRPTHQFQLPMLVNGKYRSVALFFCEDCLCLVDMDRRDLPMTVYPSADIVRTLRINPRQMELHLTQGRVLTFGTGATEALHVALQVRGWLPFQHG